ncbi:MAG: hypothetical protein P9X24_06295 [Candidatus Hatepunaea meridiana]|nr:hypothetical protein [Candidatus Hatepunaea meridiana]
MMNCNAGRDEIPSYVIGRIHSGADDKFIAGPSYHSPISLNPDLNKTT